jgi:phosphopentomutase
MAYTRFILIVLDSVGIGAMPDADRFGDAGSDTLGNILAQRPIFLPNLVRLGLANIRPLPRLDSVPAPAGAFGMAALASNGKDTTSGHWEMGGIVLKNPFPTYPDSFPPRIMDAFEKAIGRKTLGNFPASGTEIIAELGVEHMRTGYPIVYTSADSVFQVAAHEEVILIDEQYRYCHIARDLLTGPDEVARVIARPFIGHPGNFVRTTRRKDFAIPPPETTLLDRMKDAGHQCVGVGKIASIYCERGITREVKAKNNTEGVDQTLAMMREVPEGLIFTNLVDFDMLYGHRNDVDGYARALEDFDQRLPELEAALRPGDCLILTADHGCDPTTPSTDHSREYVPVLAVGPGVRRGAGLGVRQSLADIGQTIAENFGLSLQAGASFLDLLDYSIGVAKQAIKGRLR